VLDHRRTIQAVLDELNAKMMTADNDEQFSNMTKYDDPAYMQPGSQQYRQHSLPWPAYRRIAAFPITGGSEGHYVHLGILDADNRFTCIGLAKTFQGWDHACWISATAARLLRA